MDRRSNLLLWTARAAGVLVCVFLSLFALDAVSPDKTVLQNIRDVVLHLVPLFVLAGVLALSWRWEWVGGLVFSALGVAYAYLARQHADWVAVVSGPLLVVGALFLLSWRRRRRAASAAG